MAETSKRFELDVVAYCCLTLITLQPSYVTEIQTPNSVHNTGMIMLTETSLFLFFK